MFCLDLAACIPILILKMDTSKINEKEKKKVNEANLVEELVALLKHHGDLQVICLIDKDVNLTLFVVLFSHF